MPTIEVTIDLPFYLRLEDPLTVQYEEVCQDALVPELLGHDVEIGFSPRATVQIDKSTRSWDRTTIVIRLETANDLPDGAVDTFAIRNCLEITNGVITSYQAVTGQVDNAGMIAPLGTSDMQLFADIYVDGKDYRDRRPSLSFYNGPLSSDETGDFQRFLTAPQKLPLSKLFQVNASSSLERGQYTQAVVQAATAVELRITRLVAAKLAEASWNQKKIESYERETLGRKLRFPPGTARSLETYFGDVAGLTDLHNQLTCWFTPLRNDVIHRGRLVTHDEARRALKMVGEYLQKLV